LFLSLFICSPLPGYHGVYNLCSCWRGEGFIWLACSHG